MYLFVCLTIVKLRTFSENTRQHKQKENIYINILFNQEREREKKINKSIIRIRNISLIQYSEFVFFFFYKIEHESFFFSLLDCRPEGALPRTRRSSSVSNQSSTAPINTLTTYLKKLFWIRKKIIYFIDRAYITKTKWKLFSLNFKNFLSFGSVIISYIKIWNSFIPIIQITVDKM